jgi:hypothetical protein
MKNLNKYVGLDVHNVTTLIAAAADVSGTSARFARSARSRTDQAERATRARSEAVNCTHDAIRTAPKRCVRRSTRTNQYYPRKPPHAVAVI